MSDELKKQFKALDPGEVFKKAKGGKVTNKGRDSWINCPFPNHEDKNPSCHLDVKNGEGVFYCHTCKKGGDNIKLMDLLCGMGFQETLLWGKKEFGLVGDLENIQDPLERFADYRGYNVDSIGLYPVKPKEDGHILHFRLQLEWGGQIVGKRKRKTNDDPLWTEGDKEIRSTVVKGGTSQAFFLPTGPGSQQKPAPESIPVICEGETDAIAATDASSDLCGIGVPRPPWGEELAKNLNKVLDHFEPWPVLVPDGDVPWNDVRKAENQINRRIHIVDIPPYVNDDPKKQDVNEWLIHDRNDLKATLRGKEGYTLMRNDCVERVLKLVRERAQGDENPNKAAQEAAIRVIVPWILSKINPYADTEKVGRFDVPPLHWKFTYKELKNLTNQKRGPLTTVVKQLDTAGFWTAEKSGKGGGGGTLVHIENYFYWSHK